MLQRVSENLAAGVENDAQMEQSTLRLRCKDTKNKREMQIFRPKFKGEWGNSIAAIYKKIDSRCLYL